MAGRTRTSLFLLTTVVARVLPACSGDPTAPAGDAAIPDAGALDAAPGDGGELDAGPSAPELLVRYALDGDATEASDPRRSGTGTAVSPAIDRHGTAGGALAFDTPASVVTIANVELRPPYTVSLWWERAGHGPADPGCIGGEIAGILFAGYRFLIAIEPNHAGVSYAFSNDDAPPALLQELRTTTATTGWHHLALVDRVTSGELWIDGALAASGPLTDTARHASFLTLGGHPTFPCGMGGALDDVAVYTGALGAQEIEALARE